MFLDNNAFSFVPSLEDAWEEIRAEYDRLPQECFDPWVQREMYGEGWEVFGLVAFGRRIEAALQLCPRTAAALASVPGLTTAGFSRLSPGTHIKAHVGWVRTVYRLHLGLYVPADCAMRVGTETRSWREGASLIFDDTVEHEAWNRSTAMRAVLLVDFLRPGVSTDQVDIAPAEVQAFISQRTED